MNSLWRVKRQVNNSRWVVFEYRETERKWERVLSLAKINKWLKKGKVLVALQVTLLQRDSTMPHLTKGCSLLWWTTASNSPELAICEIAEYSKIDNHSSNNIELVVFLRSCCSAYSKFYHFAMSNEQQTSLFQFFTN